MTNVKQMAQTGKNIFCAIDLHQNKMLAGIAHERQKPVFKEYDTLIDGGVAQLAARLHQLQKKYPGRAIWVSYEASGCGFGLADRMTDEGFEVSVLAPTNLPVTVRSRTNKTDKRDVIRILEVLRGHVLAGNNLPSVWVPPPELRDDREVVRRRLEAAEKLADAKNKVHGLLRRYQIRRPKGMDSNWTKKHVRWLHDLRAELEYGAACQLSSLLRELSFFEEECELLDQELESLAALPRYRAQAQVLTAMKGVRTLTAMVFLTELGDLERFPNRRALGNYLGLTPRSWESGENDDKKGRITKQGPSRVRKVLNQAAWSVVRWDPYWREWYEHHLAEAKRKKKSKAKRKTIVAVMRHLGIYMWHLGREAQAETA